LAQIRKAITLGPDDSALKEFLLFFHEIPDRLVDDTEAIAIAKLILKEKPDSKCAQDILKRLETAS